MSLPASIRTFRSSNRSRSTRKATSRRREVIKIDAIRSLTQWSQRTSHRGGAKVGVIVPAETMHVPTANALLKTLEEPPPSTYLLLVAHQAGRLLPTIASRCQRSSAPVPRVDDGIAWLASQGLSDPASAAGAGRRRAAAASHLRDQDGQAERDAWLAALADPRIAVADRACGPHRARRDGNERRDRLAIAIDWLIAWTSDLARVAAGGAPQRQSRSVARTRVAGRVGGRPRAVSLSSPSAGAKNADRPSAAASARRRSLAHRLPRTVRARLKSRPH